MRSKELKNIKHSAGVIVPSAFADAKRYLAVVFSAVLATECGVEVGNPHPKSPTGSGSTSGALTLALADAPVDDAKHVYLDVVGLRAVPVNTDGSGGTPVGVSLTNQGKIDALALRDGRSLDLSAAQALPPGQYAGVILDLNAAAPATIVGGDDAERPLNFADGGLYVEQGFEVIAGQVLQITLHVDLRRSISSADDGAGGRRFDFGPVAHMVRSGDEGQIEGHAAPAAAASVCAYLRRRNDFDAGQFGRLPSGNPPPPRGSGPGAPPPALADGPHAARLPPTFAPDAGDITLDPDASCENAFATASVAAGRYLLTHLWPGDYSLRFFNAAGAPLAGDETTVKFGVGARSVVD